MKAFESIINLIAGKDRKIKEQQAEIERLRGIVERLARRVTKWKTQRGGGR